MEITMRKLLTFLIALGGATLIARGKLIAGAAAALAAPSLILRPIVDADDGEDRLGAVRRPPSAVVQPEATYRC